MPRAPRLALLLGLLLGCSRERPGPAAAVGPGARPARPPAGGAPETIAASTPEAQGIDSRPLIALADAVRDSDLPVLSILISRHGKLVFELYTSGLGRDEAHYLMSCTKSVLSTLVGVAIGEHLLPGADASIAELLPRSVFASDEARQRFSALTLAHVMGMSALDAPDPPRVNTPEARARLASFWRAESRVRFALTQPLLARPGLDYQYNDTTPMLASGALHQATGMTAFDYGQARLFGPLGFRHHEWMHQDPSSVDNGGYGLRLRPVDMQKIGLLYLGHGRWEGRQITPGDWVERSFSPWQQSTGAHARNYGWFWWTWSYGAGWTVHAASGWKGQRIMVLPEQDMVITTTALIEHGDEDALIAGLVRSYVMPSVRSDAPLPERPGAAAELAAHLEQARLAPGRLLPGTEPRMVPTTRPKERRRPYQSLR